MTVTFRRAADLCIDASGLLVAAGAWTLMIWLPIYLLLEPLLQPLFQPVVREPILYLLAAVCFGVLFGLFLKWIANGIWQRRKGRLAIGGTFYLFSALIMGLGSFAQRSHPYAGAQAVWMVGIPLLAAGCLLFGLFQKRVPV